MKTFWGCKVTLLITLIAALLPHLASAQVPTTQDCDGAIPVCQNVYTETNSYVGTGNYIQEVNSATSCLGSGETNSVWYTFTVQQTGNLCFSITPNVSADDYDWAVFDLTNNNCADIFNNPALEVSCNYSGFSGVTGANGLTGDPNEPCIPVTAGQTMSIIVDNFSGSANGYTLDFGASTATIFDNIPPAIQSVQTPIPCGATSITFDFSENVLCSTVDDGDFTLNGPGGPYTLSGVSGAVCAAGGTQENTFTINVSPPITTSGSFTLDLGLGSGSVTDLCGNTAPAGTLPFTIQGVIPIATSTDEICLGDSDGTITVSGSNGTGPYTFDIGTGSQASGNFTNLAAGTYTVTVTDANGCSGDTTIVIAPGPFCGCPSTTTPSIVDVTCFGGTDGSITANTVGPTGPFDYEWQNSGGAVLQTATDPTQDILAGLSAGDYLLLVTDTAGCLDSIPITIVEPTVVIANPSNDTIICNATSATISANPTGGNGGPYTLTWNNGLVGNGPHTVSPVINTCYTVIATDALGCVSSIDSVCVNLATPLTITTSGDASICPGDTTLITATGGGGNGGPYTYDWDDGATWAATGQGVQVSPNATTTYCVSVSDACGTPPATDCLTIDILPTPDVQFSADISGGCVPLEVTFTNDTDPAMVGDVQWDFGDGSTSTSNPSATNTYIGGGCFDVTLEVNSPNGCVSSTTVTDMICPSALPVAAFSWTPEPATVLFTDIQFYNGSTGNVINSWFFDDLGTSSDEHPQFQFPQDAAGSYPVTLIIENADGCIDSITQIVEIREDLIIYVPNAFTPNGDGINDFFFASGLGYDPLDFELLVFDRWGNQIFGTNDIAKQWDGTYLGMQAPIDTYVWKLVTSDPYNNEKREFYGHVTIVR